MTAQAETTLKNVPLKFFRVNTLIFYTKKLKTQPQTRE